MDDPKLREYTHEFSAQEHCTELVYRCEHCTGVLVYCTTIEQDSALRSVLTTTAPVTCTFQIVTMSSLWPLCSLGHVEGVREALAKGEDVNDQNDDNQTVLMYLAAICSRSENHVTILRLLLEQPSIDVNVVDKQRVSALHVATQQGNVAAVKLLLADRRLDVNCGDSHHITPLLMAASKPEKIEIFKLFLAEERFDMNWVSPNPSNGDITVLMCASWNSNLEAVKLLLDDPRVEVNWMDSRGMSTLHVAAAKKNNVKIFELLLAHRRVDVNCKRGPFNTTVLHMAAAKNNAEVVKLILADSRFSSANALAGRERSALSIAAVKGYWATLKHLVHHPSVDLDLKHKNGKTVDDILRY